jgi:hypothetical protein
MMVSFVVWTERLRYYTERLGWQIDFDKYHTEQLEKVMIPLIHKRL